MPQDENGNITDDKRIRASLETINYLLDHNAAVILCSHLGRPKGEVNMKYSLAPVAKRLSELLGQEAVSYTHLARRALPATIPRYHPARALRRPARLRAAQCAGTTPSGAGPRSG